MSKFEIYQNPAGDFHWRFQANNGKIIAVSSEGYMNRSNCEHAIILVKREAAQATLTDAAAPAQPLAARR